MKTTLSHLQLNISDAEKSLPFYKDLFVYLGYKIIDEGREHIGVSNGTTDFWIIKTGQSYQANKFHRKNTGINHLAFRLSSREEVDNFANEFLKPRKMGSGKWGQPLFFSKKMGKMGSKNGVSHYSFRQSNIDTQ